MKICEFDICNKNSYFECRIGKNIELLIRVTQLKDAL